MKKYVLGILTGILLMGIGFTVYAITSAKEISFTPTNSSWNVTNVEDAINDLYNNGNYELVLDTSVTGYRSTKQSIKFNLESNGIYYILAKYAYAGGVKPYTPYSKYCTSNNTSFSDNVEVIGNVGPFIKIKVKELSDITLTMNDGSTSSTEFKATLFLNVYK